MGMNDHILKVIQSEDYPMFTTGVISPEQESNMASVLSQLGIPLPEFVGEESEPNCLKYCSDADTPHFKTAEGPLKWENLIDAYNYFSYSNEPVFFGQSVFNAPGVEKMGWQLLSVSADDDIALLEGKATSKTWDEIAVRFYDFLCIAREWMADQGNIVLAHKFIQHHPALWLYDTYDEEWTTNEGHSTVHMLLDYDEKGEPSVSLRLNYFSPMDNTHRVDLGVISDSIDDAYCDLAEMLNDAFSLLGELLLD